MPLDNLPFRDQLSFEWGMNTMEGIFIKGDSNEWSVPAADQKGPSFDA